MKPSRKARETAGRLVLAVSRYAAAGLAGGLRSQHAATAGRLAEPRIRDVFEKSGRYLTVEDIRQLQEAIPDAAMAFAKGRGVSVVAALDLVAKDLVAFLDGVEAIAIGLERMCEELSP